MNNIVCSAVQSSLSGCLPILINYDMKADKTKPRKYRRVKIDYHHPHGSQWRPGDPIYGYR